MKTQSKTAGALAALALMALLPASKAQAGPTGGVVLTASHGVEHTPVATPMTITQFTDKAIINWQGFNIDINETVKFIQPGANAVMLTWEDGNAIKPLNQVSPIGQLVLVTPNPPFPLFGVGDSPPNSKCNLAGLVATNSTLQPNNFQGDHSFANEVTQGLNALPNKGQTTMGANGFMNLAGPAVAHAGLIVAKLVSETVGGSAKTAVDFYGDGEIQFAIQGAANDLAKDLGGQAPAPALDSKAPFSAADGTVLLSAQAADTIFTAVINLDGVVEAKGFAPAAVSEMAAPLAVAMP